MTKTQRISALLPSSLVDEVKRASINENLTQSAIIKHALEFWFQKRLHKDTKALANLRFDDLPTEDEWSVIQAAI